MKTTPNKIAMALTALAVSLVTGCVALAWTEPTSPAPAGNVSAPINSGATAQTKTGPLIIGNTNWSQLQFYPAVNDTYNPITAAAIAPISILVFPARPAEKSR